MEVIILAGGKGSRLKAIVNDRPKPMANINGRPFLDYLLEYLWQQNIRRVILSVGYKHQLIKEFFGNRYRTMQIVYSIEENPLGTGGAIRLAFNSVKDDFVLIMNGDTFFKVDLLLLKKYHISKEADVTIALKFLENSSRYGGVELSDNNRITIFREKERGRKGYINGGVYLLNRHFFQQSGILKPFSFEKDYLECKVGSHKFYGFISDGYFIDIGIPEDYTKAQKEVADYL